MKKVSISIARIIIKFLTRKHVKPAKILYRLCVQFGKKKLSKSQVYKWHKFFRNGREKVVNLTHACRPRTRSYTLENIEQICDLIEDDRRIAVHEICKKTGLSYGSDTSNH